MLKNKSKSPQMAHNLKKEIWLNGEKKKKGKKITEMHFGSRSTTFKNLVALCATICPHYNTHRLALLLYVEMNDIYAPLIYAIH